MKGLTAEEISLLCDCAPGRGTRELSTEEIDVVMRLYRRGLVSARRPAADTLIFDLLPRGALALRLAKVVNCI